MKKQPGFTRPKGTIVFKAGNGYTWKKAQKAFPLSGEAAGARADPRNCRTRWKRTYSLKYNGCVRRMTT